MSASSDRQGPIFTAITAVWSLALALSGHHEALLFLAPALLLAVPLAFGCYVGEGKIESLRRRRRPRALRRRAVPELVARARPVRALLPRGGTLIATDLAKRPPPHLLRFA